MYIIKQKSKAEIPVKENNDCCLGDSHLLHN